MTTGAWKKWAGGGNLSGAKYMCDKGVQKQRASSLMILQPWW